MFSFAFSNSICWVIQHLTLQYYEEPNVNYLIYYCVAKLYFRSLRSILNFYHYKYTAVPIITTKILNVWTPTNPSIYV